LGRQAGIDLYCPIAGKWAKNYQNQISVGDFPIRLQENKENGLSFPNPNGTPCQLT